jgi:signal transduction histidine kinase
MHDIGGSKLLERGILSAVEQEQKRMGRDLHDGLCQLLTATKFKITLLEHKLARKSLVEASEARALEGQLNQAIKQAYGLALGLNPVKLVARGLMSALEELAAAVESAFQLRCVCQFPKPVPVRDPAMANHLYRITQEAVQNAVKQGPKHSD